MYVQYMLCYLIGLFQIPHTRVISKISEMEILTITPAIPIPVYPMMCSFSLKKSVIADRQSWKHLIHITHTAHSCVANNPLRGVVGQHTAADGLFLKWDSAVPMWQLSVTADIRLYLGVRESLCTQIIRRLWCGASAAVQLWRWKVKHCDTGGFVCDILHELRDVSLTVVW